MRRLQAFAAFLGRADDVLDPSGGTDIFQMAQQRLELTSGLEELRCMRLSPKGLLRWYAGCCNTPVGNTPPLPRLRMVGVIHSFMDHAGDGRARDEVLGPVRARVFGRYARDGASVPDAYPGVGVPILPRILRLVLRWSLPRRAASPFFDAATGKPVAAPRVAATG